MKLKPNPNPNFAYTGFSWILVREPGKNLWEVHDLGIKKYINLILYDNEVMKGAIAATGTRSAIAPLLFKFS